MDDDLLVKYLLQEATPGESRQVETWIGAGEANQRYFEHFKLIWDQSQQLAAQSRVDEDLAWKRFQQRVIDGGSKTPAIVLSINSRLRPWRIAAALLITGGVIAMILFFARHSRQDAPVILAATTASQVDTLPDGSVITLNKHSSLSYAGAFNKDGRAVSLVGEAFFSVKPNKNKPFVVHVNGVTVTVTGTSFNIKTNGNKTEVIVETGTVQVSNHQQTVSLTPKEKVIVNHPDSVLVKEDVTDQLYRYYRDKTFVCDHTPLWKVVQVLNEAYDVNIIIESKEKKQQEWTTTLHNQPLDSVIHYMTQTFDFTVIRNDPQIILK
jgi:ferric-dicitrate binding protein FerR (iron transport regulator)